MAHQTHTLPFTPLQTAIITRLGADGGTSALTVYEAAAVPLNASFPYGTVQIVESTDASTFTTDGRTVEVAVQYMTRHATGSGSDDQVFDPLNAIVQALTSSSLTVTGYDALRTMGPPNAGLTVDVQDGFVYRRATARLRFRLVKQ